MNTKHMEAISSSKIFNNVPAETISEMINELKVYKKEYGKGEIVALEGEYNDKAGIVAEGALCTRKERESGNVHVIDLYETGYCFGVENAVSRTKINPVSTYALKNSVVYFFPVEELMSCSAREIVISNMMRLLADENMRKIHKVDILSRQGSRDRIMIFLTTMVSKKKSNSFRINMSQEQFAQFLALNRATLTSELNALRRDGIIEFKKDYFTVLKTDW